MVLAQERRGPRRASFPVLGEEAESEVTRRTAGGNRERETRNVMQEEPRGVSVYGGGGGQQCPVLLTIGGRKGQPFSGAAQGTQ